MKNVIYLLTAILMVSCADIKREVQTRIKNEEGLKHFENGEYALAIASFKEVIKDSEVGRDMKAQVMRNMAQVYYVIEENDSSLYYSELAARCFPEDSYDYLVNIADVQVMKGEVGDAIDMLDRANKKSPNRLESNNALGLIYLGEYDEEYYDPEKALTYNLKVYKAQADKNTQDVLALNYMELEDYDNARIHYIELQKKYPDMEDYIYQLGELEYMSGNRDKADDYFEAVVKKNPDYKFFIEMLKETND